MKKLSFKLMIMLMGVLAMSIAFTACSDDDDEDITKANITGKWTFEKAVINGVEDTDTDEDCATQRDYLEFLTNGTYQNIYFDEDCQQHLDEGEDTWTLSGNILTLSETYTHDNKKHINETVYTVKKLDAKNMVLHIKKELVNGKEGIIDWNGDDKNDDVTIYVTRL